MATTHLADRAVLEILGEDARSFLDRLVTSDLDQLAPGSARYAALLTPQGKIISDFVLFAAAGPPERLLVDAPASAAAELAKRLALYRLRAKVAVRDRSDELAVLAGWDGPMPAEAEAAGPDPRLPALGWRAIVAALSASHPTEAADAYHARRIALGVPEAGRDFALGDAFPHEALMDQLAGIDFDKGCYVGQEVVSRMQHRGTARTRVVALTYAGGRPPAAGSDVVAGGRTLGRLGEGQAGRALAMLRVDRTSDAIAAGDPIRAGEVELSVAKPAWIRFPYPGELPASAA